MDEAEEILDSLHKQVDRLNLQPRLLDVRLCRIKDVRTFIDEIPADHPTTNPTQPACDFLCHLAEQEMEPAE